ncbi:unnamed protein product [Rotaria sordida]|uniref:EF-hand domain-containing protein n=1 Tax=Rotaria sordida TaxID=392033 RepID=A0A815KXI4_9BILA|nr:unnamed protein product [Rotaria sordida]CAF1399112.1 unnamed protein product [Rotaria sordida]
MYEELLGEHDQNGVLVDKVFTIFDTNEDGAIDFTEFIVGITVFREKALETRLERVFDIIDVSGDGYISFDEMLNFMSKVLILADPQKRKNIDGKTLAAMVFTMFGLNNTSQKISKRQFVEGCQNNEDLRNIFQTE